MSGAYLELALQHADPQLQLFLVVLSLVDELEQVFVPVYLVEHPLELGALVDRVDVEAVTLEGVFEQPVLVAELLQLARQGLLLLLVGLLFLLAVLVQLHGGGELLEPLLLAQERGLDEQVGWVRRGYCS